jgi:protein-tyrosine phosphatase
MPPPLAADASFAPLVLDDEGEEPRRFRSTTSLGPGEEAARGWPVACSASAQFSALAWAQIRARLQVPDDRLYVMDLRAESHGFLGDAAVSWYARQNWGCAGLAADRAARLEEIRLELLLGSPVVQVTSAAAVKQGQGGEVREIVVGRVASEQQLLGLPPGHYVRLPITDHTGPSEAVIQDFLAALRAIPRGAHLHVHCRGGKGRTATIVTMIDILSSAPTTSLRAILARMHAFHGYDLESIPAAHVPKAPYIQERLDTLRAFYERARAGFL